ncbi:hypothetical protein HDU76_011249 [Blyttiomyces sp. JEL0837]|nr:hypothetical protein HDU76_011249 [Blyttiomyces sp. JEL0837]
MYYNNFADQDVDFNLLLTLNDAELKELGVKTFGSRKRIVSAIRECNSIRQYGSKAPSPPSPSTPQMPRSAGILNPNRLPFFSSSTPGESSGSGSNSGNGNTGGSTHQRNANPAVGSPLASNLGMGNSINRRPSPAPPGLTNMGHFHFSTNVVTPLTLVTNQETVVKGPASAPVREPVIHLPMTAPNQTRARP